MDSELNRKSVAIEQQPTQIKFFNNNGKASCLISTSEKCLEPLQGNIYLMDLDKFILNSLVKFEYGVEDFDLLEHEGQAKKVLFVASCENSITVTTLDVRSLSDIEIANTYSCHYDVISSINLNNITKSQLLTSSYDNSISLWDLVDGVNLTLNEECHGHESRVYASQWDLQDPKVFHSISADKTLRKWDVGVGIKNGSILYKADSAILSLTSHKAEPHILFFSTESGLIMSVDLRKPQDPLTLHKEGDLVNIIRRNPYNANEMLITCGDPYSAKLLSNKDGAFEKIYEEKSNDYINCAAFSSASGFLLGGLDKKVSFTKLG